MTQPVPSETSSVFVDYRQGPFSIDDHLLQFFEEDEITEFRKLQESTGMLISGSLSLQFFAKTKFPGSDCDLYVETYSARKVTNWLLSIGYLCSADQDHESYSMTGIQDVTKFLLDGIEMAPIHLVVCETSPIDTILRFHSSELKSTTD